MSHFTVMVTAEDQAELESRLLPYHEYECTGIEEYTQEIVLHEAANFESDAREIIDGLKGDGILKELYEAYVAAGDYAELFDSWEGGYLQPETGDWVRRTNPDAKWDWFVVGGRWSGLLKLRAVPLLRGNVEVAGLNRNEIDFLVGLYQSDRAKFDETVAKYGGKSDEIKIAVEQIAEGGDAAKFADGDLGRPGVFGKGYNRSEGRADTALASAIDWSGMKTEQFDDYMRPWHQFREHLALVENGNAPDTEYGFEAKAREQWDEEGARGDNRRAAFENFNDWLKYQVVEASLQSANIFVWNNTFQECADLLYLDEDEYAAQFENQALTYAFVDAEGHWFQRGEMGWFGMDDERGTPDYDVEFWKFVESLEPDQRVYVVDCHI